jgi:hypothetical protein
LNPVPCSSVQYGSAHAVSQWSVLRT